MRSLFRPLAAPTRRWHGLTWVGWLNFIVLRWFFVRLAYGGPVAAGRPCRHRGAEGGVATIEIDFAVQPPPTRWFLNRWIWPVPWVACRYVGRPCGQFARYERLEKAAREIARHQTPAGREEQALDLAYGNLAASTNHKPTREAFAELAAKRGWDPERYAAWWADARRWWKREGGA